ncbi:MAG TPA: FAD-dependent oxidoreductase, partial [Chromatiales bacterium]|nr:FAD-dependent oxidoreductase [Chromatiales bacterium]
MTDTIVIAGAGHAAGQTVISLRQHGFDGRLIVIGEEPYPPYQRPPLSKKFLAGEMELERLWLRPEKFYTEHNVELRLSTRVERIDRDRKRLALSDGSQQDYDKLVLATGSRVRRCDMLGADLPGVHYLRTIDDTLAIQEHFRPDAHLVVIGAGYIGLEVAAIAVSSGLKVTVRELADRVMERVVSPELSAFYQQAHREAGVELLLSQPPGTVIHGDTRVRKVVDGDGQEFPADFVVIGIGVLPVTELAEAAGLECDNGIVVDEYCVTSDPDIFA